MNYKTLQTHLYPKSYRGGENDMAKKVVQQELTKEQYLDLIDQMIARHITRK